MHVVPSNAGSDVLFPARALLPLSAPGGGQHPLPHVPAARRPLAAALAVTPVEAGKHDTTATRWNEDKRPRSPATAWSSRTPLLTEASIWRRWDRCTTAGRHDSPLRTICQMLTRSLLAEAQFGVGGVLTALDGVLWVNNPARVAFAEYKPVQLRVASDCGLQVPRTLVTNDHCAAREFVAAVGGKIVCKTLSSLVLSEGGKPRITYTHQSTSPRSIPCPWPGLHIYYKSGCPNVTTPG